MIYKFKSRATGDLVMLGPQGDQVLRLLGRDPSPKGIIEVDDMPSAVALLELAVADEEEAAQAQGVPAEQARDGDAAPEPTVGLRQRVWPFVEALKRAHAEGQPLVWGV